MLFGFTGREESEEDGGTLVSLGNIQYDDVCLSGEKVRLGINFRWGIETDGVVKTQVNVTMVDFKLEDWQLYIGIATVTLNLLAVLILSTYFGYKCRRCCRSDKVGESTKQEKYDEERSERIELHNLPVTTTQERHVEQQSERIELTKNPSLATFTVPV